MSFGSLDFATELRVWQRICAEVVGDEPHAATLRGKLLGRTPVLGEDGTQTRDESDAPVFRDGASIHMFFLKLLTPPDYRGMGKAFVPFGDDADWAAALRTEVATWYARVLREREGRDGAS